MIPVQTPQHLALVGAVVSFGFACALAVAGVLVSIGTLDHEARPLLAAMSWARARRTAVLGLLWGARGVHKAGRRLADAATQDDGYVHPLDEEAGDGTDDTERPVQRDGARRRTSHGAGAPGLPPVVAAPGPESLRRDGAPVVDAGDGLGAGTARGEETDRLAGDLTGEPGDDWTDTLHAINAEHHVKPHDPPGPEHLSPPPGGSDRLDADTDTGTGPGDSLDALIEAHRQETTADVFLLPVIAADLGFDSVRSWLESWDRKRQAVTA